MDTIKNILINYWPQILAILIFIFSFILQLIKKKPLNDIFSVLIPLVIHAVEYAEEQKDYDPWNKSQDKLNTAVAYVMVHLCDYYGLERNAANVQKFERYRSLIKRLIEDVLSTPQKKVTHEN